MTLDYTCPGQVDTALTLRAFGLRDTIHPRDAIAFLYRDPDLAAANASINEQWGHTVHTLLTDGGIVNLVDLRAALLGYGAEPTDPALPDDYRGGAWG